MSHHAKMAKTVVTTDDIDGTSDAQTVTFSLNGAAYEIDLGKKNLAALEKVLKPYVGAARQTSGRSARAKTVTPGRASRGRSRRTATADTSAVRAWAAENGFQVSDRGRISSVILEQYSAAH